VGLLQLVEAFRRVLRGAAAARTRHVVQTETVTVQERMRRIMTLLAEAETVDFHHLLQEECGGTPSRAVLVASFLAILELVRLAAIRVYQGRGPQGAPEGPLHLRRAISSEDWAQRIADVM